MVASSVPPSPIRVVVASSDRVYAKNLDESLTTCGMEVLCHPGRDAGPGADDDLPGADVLLVEYPSPDAGRWDLLQRVRVVAPLLEVVVISADPTVGDAVRALRTGVFAVLEYPVSVERLTATIRDACERKRRAEARMRQLNGEGGQRKPAGPRFRSGSHPEDQP